MNPNLFDRVSRRFGERRLSRRAALTQGGACLVAGAAALTGVNHASAQDAAPVADATPAVAPQAGNETEYLFVQSFQSGSIAPAGGELGTHTVTLEQGLGQTISFADRPSHEVGANSTPAFLEGLGFDPVNPPNAALVVETAPGETDIAVVELFNPTYDESTHTATYGIAVLANWQNDLEMGFHETPTDLSEMPADFGAAHLFIDGCATRDIVCLSRASGYEVGRFPNQNYCYRPREGSCAPCWTLDAGALEEISQFWDTFCNDNFTDCDGNCRAEY